MPATDAIELVNWIPQQYGVRCRKGWREWCTGMGGAPINTVMSYQPNRENLTSFRLFAATDSNVYDVTASSATPPVSRTLPGTAGYGYLSNVQFSNSVGSFLLVCSHQGGYFHWNGTAWTTPTFGTGAGQVGGVDPANLCFVTTWKSRVWFIERDSTRVWYLPTSNITGTAVLLDVGPFMKRGGKVAFIASWTIDAGEGIDDFLVIGGENGDILVYKGTDPSSAATFGLVGIYYAGFLVLGRRPFVTFGGDLLVLSEFGIQPLSYLTRGGQSLLRASSTDYLGKIQPRLAELVTTYATQPNWFMAVHPKENLLLVNVPAAATSVYDQYALYTNTNAWTVLRNIPMISAHIANNQMYFGTPDGRVGLAFEGFFDAVALGASTGNSVLGVIQPSYSYFGGPGMNKHFTMVRPTFLAVDQPSLAIAMLADFRFQAPTTTFSVGSALGGIWDTSTWDAGVWGGALNVYQNWLSVESVGYTGSLRIEASTVGDSFLASIDYMMEPGGVL